jgi:CelD/BcsL family acetyltransferase involved in cellulose biosynthesis
MMTNANGFEIKRFDGRGMSGSGAAYSASIAAWPSAQVVAARNRGRTVLRSTQRFAWRMLPRDFPPVTTVQRYLYAWRDSGVSSTINHLLLARPLPPPA